MLKFVNCNQFQIKMTLVTEFIFISISFCFPYFTILNGYFEHLLIYHSVQHPIRKFDRMEKIQILTINYFDKHTLIIKIIIAVMFALSHIYYNNYYYYI